MASRRLASILIIDGTTCIKTGETIFPLWRPQPHIDYMLSGSYTDLIVASNDANTLINLDIDCRINMIAALGWSGVAHIERLFNAGYSKVFFGGARRAVLSEREEQIFAKWFVFMAPLVSAILCTFPVRNHISQSICLIALMRF